MSTQALDQRQMQTLGQLLSAGGQNDVPGLLRASLERLVAFWPAQAGVLLYQDPHGDIITLQSGELQPGDARVIGEAREGFARRTVGSEPSIGYYALDDDRQLMELPLRSGNQTVGLLHLVTREEEAERHEPTLVDEDMIVMLVRAIGGEADKLAMLQRAEQDLRELHLLYQVGQSLTKNLNLSSLLEEIQQRVPEVMGVERCSIMLLNHDRQVLVVDALDETTNERRELYVPLDHGIASWVINNGVGQIVNDVENDPRWYDGIDRNVDFVTRAIVCAPIQHGGQPIGVIEAINKRSGEPFTERDLRLLTTIAAQAAIAVENARLVRSLQEERDRLLAKEAEVRATIARDLHDGPTQSIAAIAMNIEFIKRLMRAMPDRVERELEVLGDLVQKTAFDIRSLLFELRPLGLETQGLLATLRQYVNRWRDPSGAMQLRLEAPSSLPRLPVEVEGAMFIIIQEAVNNARKHAGPSEVTIYLYQEEDQLVASVRDRGHGFNLAAVESTYNTRGSLGLKNMRERAELIGGECRIRTSEGEGTTVEVRVPLT